MPAVTRRKVFLFPVLLTNHVFEKIRSIDLTLAEFALLLGGGEVIEERRLDRSQLKELVIVLDWTRPLHVVIIVDACRSEERIVTVYEPHPSRWSRDFRRRRA